MKLRAIPLIALLCLATTASPALAQIEEEWETNACTESYKSFARVLDLDVLAAARTRLASVTSPAGLLGKTYSFEEAIAVTERHLKWIDPQLANEFQTWIQASLVKPGLVAVRDLESAAQSSQLHKHKRLLGFLRKLSFNESFRKSSFVVDWSRFGIESELDLFRLESQVIEFVARIHYGVISNLKAFKRNPQRRIQDKVELARDKVLLQYSLAGESGLEPSTLELARESVSLIKHLTLGPFLDSNTGARLTPAARWILERYGARGLTRYYYFKFGPSIALRFATAWYFKLRIVFKLGLICLFADKAVIIASYYRQAPRIEYTSPAQKKEAEAILKIMDNSPEKILREARQTVNPPEPPPVTIGSDPDLRKTIVVPGLSETERKELNELIDAVETELAQGEEQ